ncbi:MOSC N-terminal beta barrel domain-containing protein [Chryseolinea sp. T2]|uniref:MOSC domain-containing protein n=1 Tax=Chryseolinea sp. T2 TaxID=3129255 RepID=UPI0030784F91
MLTLSEIRIYPIKSLSGISKTQSRLLPKGLEHDRRWMLVDESGMFMTQRVHTSMALFHMQESAEGFVVSREGESIVLPYVQSEPSGAFEVQIWDDRVWAFEVNPAFSSWFTRKLGIICRLVAFPEQNARQIDPSYAAAGENVSLADAYPLMIIGESSLADLNSKLRDPLPMTRFRPNLVFSGGAPFEEDTWKEFTIGENAFTGVKRCARCVLTTIDPLTGQKGAEPLKTLATYRKANNKIYFGQNVIARTTHEIKIGDKINLITTHQAIPRLTNNAQYDSAIS